MPAVDKTQRFVRLFAESQRRLYAFIRTQVKSPADADDILGQTSVVLWEKFDTFEQGTDFVRWACRVARLEVLAHYRNRRRLLAMFTDEVAERIADAMIDAQEEIDVRHHALAECLEKLPERQHDLIRRRYTDEASIKVLAQNLHRSESAVYKTLARIHDALYDCVNRTLQEGTT